MPHKTSEREAEPAEQAPMPRAVLCHRSPGRFRVRVAERRKDETYLARVRQGLERHSSVRQVETVSLTGSVLVLHRGDGEEVLQYAETAGLFRVAPGERRPPAVVQLLDRLDRFDEDFLFARMGEKPQRAATGLFMLAVLQVVRGSVLPSAPSLLGEAMALLRQARAQSRDDEADAS